MVSTEFFAIGKKNYGLLIKWYFKVVCATVSFGMGIEKRDIQGVLIFISIVNDIFTVFFYLVTDLHCVIHLTMLKSLWKDIISKKVVEPH